MPSRDFKDSDILNDPISISSLSDLDECIRSIRWLIECKHLSWVDGNLTVDEYLNEKEHPDIINMLFLKPDTETYYFLGADVYHGKASFKPVHSFEKIKEYQTSIQILKGEISLHDLGKKDVPYH